MFRLLYLARSFEPEKNVHENGFCGVNCLLCLAFSQRIPPFTYTMAPLKSLAKIECLRCLIRYGTGCNDRDSYQSTEIYIDLRTSDRKVSVMRISQIVRIE